MNNFLFFLAFLKRTKVPTHFNDKYVLIIGIPVVVAISFFAFGNHNSIFNIHDHLKIIIFNLLTTITIWLGVRKIVMILWKKFPWEKNPVKHLLWEIILVFMYVMLVGSVGYFLIIYTGFVPVKNDPPVVLSVTVTLLITYLITSIHEGWFFFHQWNVSLMKAEMLKKENLESHYETLKNQINPHFLFNTLNTLTNLIEEQPKTAVYYVEMTSKYLRTILSLKDKQLITVKEEIELIENFYQLQKERFGESLKIMIDIPESCSKSLIPPLSIQMLVENAIKHNIISMEKSLLIRIFFSHPDIITVSNNLQKKKQYVPSSGIGLQNIKNRYSYFTEKKIRINEKDGYFSVEIPVLETY